MRFTKQHTRDSFQEFSTKARDSGFQTHEFRKSKNAHRERFAKEMAKEKNELNRTNIFGVLATAQIMMISAVMTHDDKG